jgi:hypothetical protein
VWSTTPAEVSEAATTKYEHHQEDNQYCLHGHRSSPPTTAVQRVTTSSNLVSITPPAYWTFIAALAPGGGATSIRLTRLSLLEPQKATERYQSNGRVREAPTAPTQDAIPGFDFR